MRKLSDELEIYWRGMRDGASAEARLRFEAAQKRARSLKLPYLTAQELSEGSLTWIHKRVELLVQRNSVDDEQEVSAVLRGGARPTLHLSGLVDEVEAMQKLFLARMSENQLRRWRKPRKLAVKALTGAIGYKLLGDVSRTDTIAYRLVAESSEIASADKGTGQL